MIEKPSYEYLYRYVYEAEVHQKIYLTGPWQGWRICGRHLVSPDRERIPVRELIGLLIHYRGKFGHHQPAVHGPKSAPSNVVQFSSAAVERLQARQQEEAGFKVGSA